MLAITDEALERLETLLNGAEAEDEQCLRLTVDEPGSFGLALDWPREGDELYFRSDRVVIVVEDEIVSEMEDAMLDVVDGPDGPQLGFLPLDDDDEDSDEEEDEG